jgi:hypothetical protein
MHIYTVRWQLKRGGGTFKGRLHTDESKRKMSESSLTTTHRGKKSSQPQRMLDNSLGQICITK